MTNKQKLIIKYLSAHNGQGYYIDIRQSIGMQFDSEDDFDKTLLQLSEENMIFENDGDTLYKIIKHGETNTSH